MARLTKERKAARRKAFGGPSLAVALDSGRLAEVDPASLARIDDLEVALVDAGVLGLHPELRSARFGLLASFPYWDHAERDLARATEADLPALGPSGAWSDVDQGWRMVIERRGDEVLVFEGGDEHPRIHTAFRVPLPRWREAWRAAAGRFSPRLR